MSLLKECTLLYVEDEPILRREMAAILARHCSRVIVAANGREALLKVAEGGIDLVLTDIRMPEMDGMALTERLNASNPDLPVVLYTAFTDSRILIRGIELGVAGFVQKPADTQRLVAVLEKAALPALQRRQITGLSNELELSLGQMIGGSAALKPVARQTARIARTDYPVLIQGETGTGKSRLAGIIHALSHRADRPFITARLATIPEAQVPAELFGQGREPSARGLFKAAMGGTLFLDDVDTLPASAQALLLQLVEKKHEQPRTPAAVGAADVRIIAASNRNLAAEAQTGRFRPDLYHRLAGMVIELPPLRTIAGDIPVLARQFLMDACIELGEPSPPVITETAVAALQAHPWHGNIRELRNTATRLAITGEPTITARDIAVALSASASVAGTATANLPPALLPLTMAEIEKWALQRALAAASGKKMVAARLLGMNYYTFRRHLVRHGLATDSEP